MSSQVRIDCLFGASANTIKGRLRMIPGFQGQALDRIADLITASAGGVHTGRFTVATTAVSAFGTATLTGVDAADTITIGATVLTGSDTPSGPAQFLTGTTDTLSAVSLASVINANPTLNKYVTATSALTVVTITSQVPGLVGNFIPLASSDGAEIAVSGAFFTGGNEDANVVMYNGI